MQLATVDFYRPDSSESALVNADTILHDALLGVPPGRDECIRLLSLPEDSYEADRLRETARIVSHQRFKSQGVLKAQIGIDTSHCAGACKFCGFGDGVSDIEVRLMPIDEIVERAISSAGSGELYMLLLMTMHDFRFPRLLKAVEAVRAVIPGCTQLAVNIGDIGAVQARELADAGVGGAYHVRRLREGIDTALSPAARVETIQAFLDAGIQWYTCCEPIGPEHSPEELAEEIFLGITHGCSLHATMHRIAVPGTPMASRGQISEIRLAQITAVVALATIALPGLAGISVHEPNLPSLMAGANAITAESGANPRDTIRNTEDGRGRSIEHCKALLREAGYLELLRADGSSLPL